MHIISTFEHSTLLELAITQLIQKGISNDKILAVPLDKRAEERKIFDTIHYSDGVSLFDTAAIIGTLCMALGTIFGFQLKWGPIIVGLAGLFVGALIGFALDFFIGRKRRGKNRTGDISGEVVVIVNCSESQANMVVDILWEHTALGLARLERKN